MKATDSDFAVLLAITFVFAWGRPLPAQTVATAAWSGPDMVCDATLRAWTAGIDRPEPLVTFGSRAVTADAIRDGLGSEADAPEAVLASLDRPRSVGRLAVGAGLGTAWGPGLAGSTQAAQTGEYVYPGPRPDDRGGPHGRLSIDFSAGRMVSAFDVSAHFGTRPSIHAAVLGWVGRDAAVTAGALPLRTGPECAGGLVLSGEAGPAFGIELRQRRPFRLPVLGRMALGLQVGAMAEAGPGSDLPIFHSMRVELSPSPGVRIGLNRAVLFGGSASEVPITPRTVGLMLIGITDASGKDSDFENQVASIDVLLRARISDRPVRLGAEYAADDTGLAFLRVPALRLSAEARFGPHPSSWMGLELVRIQPRSRRYPPWYRHGALSWGWTDRGSPLGSTLAGEGTSASATWGVTLPAVAVGLRAGVVHRGAENLLAPDLGGTGVQASVSARGWVDSWDWWASAGGVGGADTWLRWTVTVQRRF